MLIPVEVWLGKSDEAWVYLKVNGVKGGREIVLFGGEALDVLVEDSEGVWWARSSWKMIDEVMDSIVREFELVGVDGVCRWRSSGGRGSADGVDIVWDVGAGGRWLDVSNELFLIDTSGKL